MACLTCQRATDSRRPPLRRCRSAADKKLMAAKPHNHGHVRLWLLNNSSSTGTRNILRELAPLASVISTRAR